MRDEDQVRDELDVAIERAYQPTHWHGMTYEQGVRDALAWACGDDDDRPISDQE